jgi:hypothetical protein
MSLSIGTNQFFTVSKDLDPINGLTTSIAKDPESGDRSHRSMRVLENRISHLITTEYSKDSSIFETEELCSNPDEDAVVSRT